MVEMNSPALPENYAREIGFILRKRLGLIIATILVASAATLALAMLWPPKYGAYTSILIKSQRIENNLGRLEPVASRTVPLSESNLQSELSILTSEELLAETLIELSRNGGEALVRSLGETPAERINYLKEAFTARIVPTSNVIELLLVGDDGPRMLEVLQTIVRIYPAFRDRVFNAVGAVDFLSNQVERLREELAKKNEEVSAFLERTGLSSADHQIEANLGLQRDLKSSLASLNSTIGDVDGEIRYLNDLLALTNIARFAAVRLSDGTVLSGRPEVVARVQQQRARLEVLRANAGRIEERIRDLDSSSLALRRNQLTYRTLEREATVLGSAYQTLLTRYNEARINDPKAEGQGSDVSFIVPPRLADSPLSPNPKIVILLGVLASVLLGLSFAFVREFFDRTFARAEDVQRVLGVPLLFTIPEGLPKSLSRRRSRERRTVTSPRSLLTKAAGIAIFLGVLGLAILLPANARTTSYLAAAQNVHTGYFASISGAVELRPALAGERVIR